MSVVHLDTVRRQPVAAVVECLQDMLARAESGEIIAVAIGAVRQGRTTASVFVAGEATIADLYLGIERCKLRLLDEDGTAP